MPKKTNPVAPSQMLRIDRPLLEWITEQAAASGRTPRQEIEIRLRESMARGAAPAASPWARAVGEVMTRLASEIEDTGTGPDERNAMLVRAVDHLLREMRPPDVQLNKDDETYVDTLVHFFLLKLRRENDAKVAKPKLGIALADPDAFFAVRVPASESSSGRFSSERKEPARPEKGEGKGKLHGQSS